MSRISEAIQEIEEAAKGAVWAPETLSAHAVQHDPTIKAYVATRNGWRLLVASYERDGSRGHDGTATKLGLVLRLPNALAEQLFKEACR